MKFLINTLKYFIGVAVFTITLGLAVSTIPVDAAPVKGVVLFEYKVGRTTIYEWRTHHNRLCTMVVDQYASNAPFISCN